MFRLLAMALALVLTACASEEHTVVIRFEPSELANRVEEIELTLVSTCTGQPTKMAGSPVRPLRQAKISRETKQKLGTVDAREYGLYAVAISGGCRFAAGCQSIALGGNSRNLIVRVQAIDPPPACLPPPDAGPDDKDGGPDDKDGGPDDFPPGTQLALSFDAPAQDAMIAEESANAFVGTLKYGAMISEEGGHSGGGLDMPGGNAVLEFEPILPLTDSLTIEAWVRPQVNAGWATVINRFYSNIGYWIGLSRNGLGVEFWVDVSFAAAAPIELETWTHLAGTFDSKTGQVLLYMNGNQVGAAAHPFPAGVAQTPMSIGNAPEGLASADFAPFTGTIDDVRVLSVVRAPEEICADAGGEWNGFSCEAAGKDE